jgi:hypothetical protein
VAFWSSWFAPKCEDCGTAIVGYPPFLEDGRKLCSPCHDKALAAAAKKAAEVEARRLAEEEARQKFEGKKQFGVDPRAKG